MWRSRCRKTWRSRYLKIQIWKQQPKSIQIRASIVPLFEEMERVHVRVLVGSDWPCTYGVSHYHVTTICNQLSSLTFSTDNLSWTTRSCKTTHSSRKTVYCIWATVYLRSKLMDWVFIVAEFLKCHIEFLSNETLAQHHCLRKHLSRKFS